MTLKKLFLILLCLLSLCACQDKEPSGVAAYLDNPHEIQGRAMGMEQHLGSPYSMAIVDDTLLCLGDQEVDGRNIAVINLKTEEFKGNFIYTGRGPNEVPDHQLSILNFPQKDVLLFTQSQRGVMNAYNIEEQQIVLELPFESDKLESSPIAPRPGHIHKMRDYYVGWGPFIEAGRFGIYGKDAKLIRFDGSFPDGAKGMSVSEAFFAYQGSLAANPEGNYFAYGSVFCDNLAFYHVTDGETLLINSSQSYEPKISYQETKIGENVHRSSSFDPDCIMSYVWGHGTKDHCFMAYSGKRNDQEGSLRGEYILVFDWNGNHVKTFKTDMDFRTFCVNESETKIYATVLNDDLEYDIVGFDIRW